MNISLIGALLRLCLTISPSLFLALRFFIPSKPRLPPFSRNFSTPSFCEPAYCADRTLKYTRNSAHARTKARNLNFEVPTSNVHAPLIRVVYRALYTHCSISTGNFQTIGENQSPAAFLPLLTFFVPGIVSKEF